MCQQCKPIVDPPRTESLLAYVLANPVKPAVETTPAQSDPVIRAVLATLAKAAR